MLTPQEVSNHAFAKAVMGGYNMAMVDEFLDELTDDYTSLYKENAALKAKMKVLVDKVEEYRSTEDAMRAALLTAQKMADSMVAEAEEKKKSLLENAESEANRKIGALRDEVAQEERRLTAAKAETADFLARVRELYEREMKLLEELPEAAPRPRGSAGARQARRRRQRDRKEHHGFLQAPRPHEGGGGRAGGRGSARGAGGKPGGGQSLPRFRDPRHQAQRPQVRPQLPRRRIKRTSKERLSPSRFFHRRTP